MLLHLRVKDNGAIQGRFQVDFLGGVNSRAWIRQWCHPGIMIVAKPTKQNGVVTANVSKHQL